MDLEFSGVGLSGHHPARDAIHRDQLQQIAAGEQRHPSKLHLSHQGLISPVEQLLTGLSPGVEGATHKGSSEAAGRQAAAVFPGEGHSLGDALVDDAAADFCQPPATGFPRPEIATSQRVSEEPMDAVAIDSHGSSGIDTALGSDRMGTPGAVVISQHGDAIALLRQGRCC